MVILNPYMTDDAFSVAEAKARFALILNQAEAGAAVRITRRGKPVAVVLSEAEYERLQAPAGRWVAFSKAWRRDMQREGAALLDDAELAGLRNRVEQRAASRGRGKKR